jgi:hypothetical protein
MSGIKASIQSVMTKLQEIVVRSNDSVSRNVVARIWNNQVAHDKDGTQASFLKPAVFVEVQNGVTWQQLGEGYQSADLAFCIHLVHEQLDAADGTMEQDLVIFDLRDQVLNKLALYEPTGCGPLTHVGEQQDFDHDNVYHYTVNFICNFTETPGSKWDQGMYQDKAAPTGAQVDITMPTQTQQLIIP